MIARTFVVGLLFFLYVLSLIPLIIICALIRAREPLLAFSRFLMRLNRAVLGLKVIVEGLPEVDASHPVVYMADHQSFLDGPLLFLLVPSSPRIIIKASVFRIPIFGLGMRYVGFVPVDRRGARGGRAGIEKAAALMRDRKYSFLIFPEGTRSRDSRIQPFRRGGFFLAIAAGAPIVPVTVEGTFRLMPRGRWVPRRGTIRVAFHPAVETAGTTQDLMAGLMNQVRGTIVSGFKGDVP
ncbi:MAG: lysophospholipid acyltransferase family protein [Candidatus Aminicenantes bacterium]|nr:lysophospholipid acyltransferase family protein [Candidatus Aminicenantes bacterium]